MRALLQKLIGSIRRLGAAREGVAAVEFALVMPLLLLLYLGSTEASSLFTVDRRVTVIAGSLGDLVARWSPQGDPITEAQLTDYFKAARGIIVPYPTGTMKQVVSCIQVAANGTATVVWSRAYGTGATARAKNTSFSLAKDGQMATMASGGYLILSEVYYSYLPVLGMVFKDPLNLYSDSLYVPRFGVAKAVLEPGSTKPAT